MTAFTGTGRLVRLALRRDRILLPVWLLSLGVLTAAITASMVGLYTSEAERDAVVRFSAATPVTRVFDGPAAGTHIGSMTMVEGFQVLAILVALMSAQAIVRHTRLDEETGRAELVGSAVVGHHARLTAALLVTLSANLVFAGVVAAVLVGADLEVGGAVLAGASVAGVGVVFAGVAALTSQVFSSARGANTAAGAALGGAFLLRAVGDVLGDVTADGLTVISAWPSWLSPIGWGQQVRPFHQDNLDVLLLFVATTLVLVAVAFLLTVHRDLGAGAVQPRSGPATAPPGLRSTLGLAWRLHRGILLGWVVGLVVFGGAFGSVGEGAGEIVGLSEQFEQALLALAPEGGFVELFFTFIAGIVGLAVAGYTVQALLRMRSEEATGRLEPLLATAVGRSRWLASHLVIAAAGAVALLLLSGAAGAASYGLLTGDWATGVEGMVGGALVQAPAVLALGGFTVAAFGLVPRWAPVLAWSALAVSLVMGQLGALLELPQAVLNLSPFTHVPLVPAEPFVLLPVALLLGAAALAGALGVTAFRRRDLAIGA